ncbi:hybrid sensor histidine kinase/response regulator [Burkholderia ubonensis]|uniref:hybrid sensor histidine kinase/response regulator n=2 Tax=Burkholderia ubonensis TaxID=101571 RepID=UPI0007572E2B|nr:hybrid sensor histidine kinase/response regulator [Burkholderia ubonensis]KVM14868.1 hybrid sensor histidine kinase/response regulator [Burkholderia ubonensis]KVM41904.1 hybrid sensor histidine kinase/response regulator [Burkholderia ubonensis]KVX43980.1 hybrid sensor histidine kinase/response regulator [Burkholderia ubonensis]KVX88096.1 hybrid sensor histidine kinase/response regulator [Burkholderia ubonensis]
MRMRRAHSSAQFPPREVEAIEGERSFRSLADAIPHIVWTADPDGWVDYMNCRGLSYGGVTLEQAQAQGWESFLHPDDLQLAIDTWTRAIQSGVEFEIEYRLRRASDGAYRWFLCRALPFRDHDGKIVKWFGTETDIEDLKQARAAAERANRAKSDFLSSMSHELRSPLNAILGFAQLMASDSPPPTPSRQASIDQILRAGWHLLELINDVLDLAKIESGQVAIAPEAVALSDALRECESMIEPQARQRGIRVSFPDVEPHCHVRADRTRFRQILLNLLSNAIKYNRASGAVDVDCDLRAPGRIRVSVRDTGPGLSQGQLAQLFQPFNRLGQDAGGEEGTGIGLVVAKRLTELMGGAIGADSTIGKGSAFWIELDAASAPEAAALGDAGPAASAERATAETAAEAPAHTVLYIEDNAANRTLVEQLLARRADLRMLSAATGQLGVALARSALPQVILMDINLPDISGVDALGLLRSQPETAAIPVVALSSNAMPRDIDQGLKAGFFRYLTKPIRIEPFMHALAEAIAFAEGKR